MHHEQLPDSNSAPTSLVDLIRTRARLHGEDLAFRFLTDGENDEVALSYAEFDRRARAIGASLEARNLKGKRVLLLFPAGLDFVTSFFGCLYAGVVAVPAYPPRMNRSLNRIESIAADCDAPAALTTQAVLERVQPLLEQTPNLKKLDWLASDTMPSGLADEWVDPKIETNDLAFLQYTSGSTGTPKGVMISHANLLQNCATIGHAFELTRSNVSVFWLPSYHDMGLVGGIVMSTYVGRPNVLMSPMAFLQRPYRWLQAISKYRATTSGGPNFAYELCVRRITAEQRAKLDLSSWTLAFNGAEPVRAETLERFADMFAPCGFRREVFYPCYGLAESTLLVSGGYKADPPVVRSFDSKALENGDVVSAPSQEPNARRLVGSGQTLPGETIEIVNPQTMTRCEPDEVGEIWVQSGSVAQGYWNRPEESEHTFRARLRDTGDGPFLRTGDLGFFQGSELFVAGRLKDLIIIRGLNHYPNDIELTVEKSHTSLRPGCGAAFSIDVNNEARLAIVYEIDRHQEAEIEAIFESIRRDVAREHELQVDYINLIRIGSIPKTSSGKIQRHASRNAFLQGSLEIVAAWDSNEPEGATAKRTAKSASAAPAEAGTPSPEAPAAETPAEDVGAKLLVPFAAGPERNGPAANGAGKSRKRATAAEQVLEEVQRIAKERAKGLTLDSNISELGLDSLERMEILAAIEERFGGRFPEEVLPRLETCREVVDAVETYLNVGKPEQAGADVPQEDYRFEFFPEYLKLRQSLETVEGSGLGNPFFAVHQRVTNDTTMIDGRELINFSSYNYVGMSGDPRVTQAAKDAIDRYGTSVSASRLVSGEKIIHRELERAIADFIGVDDSIVFVGGHSTNETTIGHLFGPGDLILHDALAHNSIIQGCILSGARRRPFPHNDWRTVDKLLTDLRSEYRRVLVAIEGVYSMDGDVADLPGFIEVKQRHKAFLFVDEAHSAGVLGKHGRGIGEHFDINPTDVDLWMGTLSKSYGSCGGYIAGSKALIEYLKYTAPGFVYSVGMSPANAAAALASIRVLEAEPQRVARLHEMAKLFLSLAKKAKLNTGLSQDSPVVPIIVGNSMHSLQLSRALQRRGINVQPIMYPAVEEKAARLRFFITSNHKPEQIRYTVQAVSEELRLISPNYASVLSAAAKADQVVSGKR